MTDEERARRLAAEAVDRYLDEAGMPLRVLDDDLGHYTDGRPCWCDPAVEHYAGGDVIIHRSRDEAN